MKVKVSPAAEFSVPMSVLQVELEKNGATIPEEINALLSPFNTIKSNHSDRLVGLEKHVDTLE